MGLQRGGGRQQTVLVVEDDAAAREMYRSALAQDGYRVIAVEDGLDALRSVEAGRPHAIVLDLMLPCISGYDVYNDLRAAPATRAIPVVIVTGSEVRNLESNAMRYFLRKPFRPEDLVETVSAAIRGR
jgi:CheY-like chemotaxis protein